MLGIGIGIGIGLTQHASTAAGPVEVTVAEVRVASRDATTIVFRWTMTEDSDFSGMDAGSPTITGGDGLGESLGKEITSTGADYFEQTWTFGDATVVDLSGTEYELQVGHNVTSLAGPFASSASGSVIPLP